MIGSRFLHFVFVICIITEQYEARAFESVSKPPNILFIVVDDQSPFDLKCYNPQSALETPNIDSLAREGMVIAGAYHMGAFMGAVCVPSRYQIMCGRAVWRLPISPWGAKTCPPNLDEQTLPAIFNRAGYATMRTCKASNTYKDANKHFEVLHEADKRGASLGEGSGWHGDRVMEYLQKRDTERDTRPFFIFYGFSHPHDERDGTPELLAKYGAVNHRDSKQPPPANDKHPKLPPNYLPSHPFPLGHPNLRDEVAVGGVWERRDESTIRNELGRQFACSENIDRQIGRVLSKLKELGELENTYIVYTADHGMAIGRHGLQGKQNLYQHTWRIPFIVRGPGIKPNSQAEGNIYLGDVLATFTNLAGIEAPESNEGISAKPVLMGDQETVRDVLYGVYCGGTKPGIRCVKQGDWKLIKYDVLDGTVHETQLFNLRENPNEFLPEHNSPELTTLTGVKIESHLTNLASDPKHASKLAEMEALLLAEMRRLEDPWRLWNQPNDSLEKLPVY